MRIIIVRHGETASNLEKRIQGQTDTKLNARGEEQAEEVADILNKKEKIDAVFSSDLSRAFRTAEFIAGDNLNVIPVEGFRERYMGPIEGMLHSDAITRRNADNLPSLLSYGEDGQQLTERVAKAWNQVLADSEEKGYKTIVIVSHGSALNHLFDYLRKEPSIGYFNKDIRNTVFKRPKLGNCCVTILEDNKFVAYAEQWTASIVRDRTLI